MSIWDGFNVKDALGDLVSGHVAIETARAQNAGAQATQDQAVMGSIPNNVTERPNAQPTTTAVPTSVTTGSGQGAATATLNVGGVQVNKTALYVAGGALGIALLLKLLK